jgi:bifunctional UDP-N-acetylglucosamine pyrophosphorylase/glucosamine-1-phosphate N-acetyltransferase
MQRGNQHKPCILVYQYPNSNGDSFRERTHSMTTRSCLAVILAAGEGTRMKSSLPKVLHPIGNLSLIGHVMRAVKAAACDRIAVVVGPGHDATADLVTGMADNASVFAQTERLGTAHAVMAARPALEQEADDVIVLFGDTPFVTAGTISAMRNALANGAAVVVGGMRPQDPQGYGRLIVEDGRLTAIREHKDASEAEREITFCNGGIMAFAGKTMLGILDKISNSNSQNEFYLTDAVEIADEMGLEARAIELPELDVLGINDRVQLADAEAKFQAGMREKAMLGGASLCAPNSVYFSYDTVLGQDIQVDPEVYFGPGVIVEDGVTIRAFSHIEGAHIRSGATIGPFARLRPGADIGSRAKVGNFCEVKNATVDEGAKINHLTYIGDAHVGARTNIGAGTITCNYDGFNKFRTEIGADAFIGSNSSLVAPLTIGDGAYIASGSVITKTVTADTLAIGRARQVDKPDWAKKRRALSGKKTD